MDDNKKNQAKVYLKLSKEELIERYKRLSKALGIVPGKKEIEACDYLCSYATIIDRWGSLKKLREESEMFHNKEKSGKPIKSELEKKLIRIRIERGRRLDYIEINNNPELPRYDYIKGIYDNKALSEIWDIIEKKIPDSLYEWKNKK